MSIKILIEHPKNIIIKDMEKRGSGAFKNQINRLKNGSKDKYKIFLSFNLKLNLINEMKII